MLEKEQKFFSWVGVISFLGLMLIDKHIEALLVLVIAHLIDIKYEIKKTDKFMK